MSSNKKIVALILCIFLGYLGVHRFYLKKIGTGILYLFTMGLCGIGWIVDIILIATGKMTGLEKPHPVTFEHPPQAKVEQQNQQLSDIPSILDQPGQPTLEKIHEKESDFVLDISGDYCTIYSNGNEIFDGDIVAKRENYILAEGWKKNKQALAFFTDKELISMRACEDIVDGAAILPSGVAFAFVDSDNVIIFSESGTKSKKFGYGSAPEKSRIITDDFCAYADDIDDSVVLKCFLFDTQTSWSKTIKYDDPDEIYDVPSLMYSGGMIFVIFQNGDRYVFFKDGEKVKDVEADASEKNPVKNNQIVVDDTPLYYSFSVKIKSDSGEERDDDVALPDIQIEEDREVLKLSHLPFTPNDKEPHPTMDQILFLRKYNIDVPSGISKYDVFAIANRIRNKDFDSPTPEMAANADGFGVNYSAFIGRRKLLSEIAHKTTTEHKAAFYAYCMDCHRNNQEIGNFFESNRMQIYFGFAAVVLENNGLCQSLSNLFSDEFLNPNKRRTIYRACIDYLCNH